VATQGGKKGHEPEGRPLEPYGRKKKEEALTKQRTGEG